MSFSGISFSRIDTSESDFAVSPLWISESVCRVTDVDWRCGHIRLFERIRGALELDKIETMN